MGGLIAPEFVSKERRLEQYIATPGHKFDGRADAMASTEASVGGNPVFSGK